MIRAEIPKAFYDTFYDAIRNYLIDVKGDILLIYINNSLIEMELVFNSNISFYFGEDKICEILNLYEIHDYLNKEVHISNDLKDSFQLCFRITARFVKERGLEVSSNKYFYVNWEIFHNAVKVIEQSYPVLAKYEVNDEIQYAIKGNYVTVISIVPIYIENRGDKLIYGFVNIETEEGSEQIAALFSDKVYYYHELKFENIQNLDQGLDKIIGYMINYEEKDIEEPYLILLVSYRGGNIVDKLNIMRNIIDNIYDLVNNVYMKIFLGYFNGDYILRIIRGEDFFEIGKIKGNKLITINGYNNIEDINNGIRRLIEIGISVYDYVNECNGNNLKECIEHMMI